jgi:hypothetical protein
MDMGSWQTSNMSNKTLQQTAAVRHRCNLGFSAPLSLSFRRSAELKQSATYNEAVSSRSARFDSR